MMKIEKIEKKSSDLGWPGPIAKSCIMTTKASLIISTLSGLLSATEKKCGDLMMEVPQGPTRRNPAGQILGNLVTHLLARGIGMENFF
jgi:hypothetical protein